MTREISRREYFEQMSKECERLEYEDLDRAFHEFLGVPYTPPTPERIEALKGAFVIAVQPGGYQGKADEGVVREVVAECPHPERHRGYCVACNHYA